MSIPAPIRQAVVPAGGNGRRLEPFSITRPKCALPLGNRPLVRLAVESLAQAGVKEVFIVAGDDTEAIRKALGTGPEGVRITFLREAKPSGPIHAVLEAKDRLGGNFVVLCADCFVRPEMITEAAGLLVKPNCECAAATGVCNLPLYHHQASCDAAGRLGQLRPVNIERQHAERNMLTGLLAAGPGTLAHMAEFVGAGRADDWAPFIGFLAGKADVRVTDSDLKFAHVDYLWEIFDADRLVKGYLFEKTASHVSPTARIEDGARIEGRHVIEDGVVIESGSIVRDSWIGKGTRVRCNSLIRRCIFGESCETGPQCGISDSTFPAYSAIRSFADCGGVTALGRVTFGHPCHVSGVWDEGTGATACCSTSERRGPTETIIGPDGKRSYRSDVIKVRTCGELISSGLDSVSCFVGKGVTITVGVKIMPGRIIGPGSFIGPNVVVNHDVPADTFLALKQPVESRPI